MANKANTGLEVSLTNGADRVSWVSVILLLPTLALRTALFSLQFRCASALRP